MSFLVIVIVLQYCLHLTYWGNREEKEWFWPLKINLSEAITKQILLNKEHENSMDQSENKYSEPDLNLSLLILCKLIHQNKTK